MAAVWCAAEEVAPAAREAWNSRVPMARDAIDRMRHGDQDLDQGKATGRLRDAHVWSHGMILT